MSMGIGGRRGRKRRRAAIAKALLRVLAHATSIFLCDVRMELKADLREQDACALACGVITQPRGKRECRRVAKMRRRARNRDVRYMLERAGFVKSEARGLGWWATATGRAEWVRRNREAKRERRNICG